MLTPMPQPFHFAFFVRDLDSTRRFYGEVLGCREGRSTESWVDFDFFGNQISAHNTGIPTPTENTGLVEGVPVPMPHFGALLPWDVFQSVADRIRAAGIRASFWSPASATPDSRGSRPRCSSSIPAATPWSSRASNIRSTSSRHEAGVGRHRRRRGDGSQCRVSPHRPRDGVTCCWSIEVIGPGQGSTGAATGGFRAQYATAINVRLSLLAREKLPLLQGRGRSRSGLSAGGLSLAGHRLEPSWTAARGAAGAAERRTAARRPRSASDDIARLNPALLRRDAVIGGTFCPTDGFIAPLRF